MRDFKEKVWISKPNGIHNNHGVQIYSEVPSKIEKFKVLVRESGLIEKWRGFWQGNANDWVYVEFWLPHCVVMQDDLDSFISMACRELELEIGNDC